MHEKFRVLLSLEWQDGVRLGLNSVYVDLRILGLFEIGVLFLDGK